MDSQTRNFWPFILIIVGIFLIGGAVFWYFQSSVKPISANPTTTVLGSGEIPSDIPRVNLADAKAAFDLKTAVFVDVRDADSYTRSHIPGALSIPSSDLPNRLVDLQKSDWIITYCT